MQSHLESKMHHVLSDETSRCNSSSQEFITKKLCISAVFVFAFFSVLGGFLMGKFVSEKYVADHACQPNPERVNQFLIAITKLRNATATLSQNSARKLQINDLEKFQRLLVCESSQVTFPKYVNLSSDLSLATDHVVNNNLMVLQACYNNISNFLENFFTTAENRIT